MRRFTDIFVERPVLAIVVNLVIIIAGLQALVSLNVRQYPKLEQATVTIATPYIGADAELVRGFITTPIERSIAASDGIDYIESTSVQGLSTIQVRLGLGVSASAALADINARVNQVRADLPPEAEVPSINIEASDAQIAAMYMSFRSDILRDNQVTDYLERVVQPRLTAVPGVQKADILGARRFALRAWMQPDRMAALGVSPQMVRDALASNNFLSAVGQTKGALVSVPLTATTDAADLDEFRQLVVKRDGDTLVRLEDVAEVVLGADDYGVDVKFSGESATFMGVWVLPNANTLEVIAAVRDELESLRDELPRGMDANIAYDSTSYIEASIAEVGTTLLETVVIVVIVIFLFLGSLRSVLVPLVAIPLSLIGAVFLMQVLGFTLNLLTLLAIVLAVGLVVDDAIVVIENCERHLSEGKSRLEAATLGARELVGPILAMTVTLAAVYAPIGFQGGLTGALFREFAFTLAGAVVVSGVVALTLSPMMASRLLPEDNRRGWLGRRVDAVFGWLQRRYLGVLDLALARRAPVTIAWVVLSLAVVPMYMLSPKELAPAEDQGVLFGAVEGPPNASLEQMVAYTEEEFEQFATLPEFELSFQFTNPGGGFGGVRVVPWAERDRDIFEIKAELEPKIQRMNGIRAPLFLRPPLPSPGRFPVEVVIASTIEHARLLEYAEQIKQTATQSGLFAFPPLIDTKIDQHQVEIQLDKDKVAALGLSMRQVGSDLAATLGGNYVNRFSIDGRSYKVIAQVERSKRLNPEQLGLIHVSGPQGELIPLDSIASFEAGVQPRSLNRFAQLNAIKISGVATQSLDDAIGLIEDEAEALLPPGSRVDYTGETRQLRQEGGKFLPSLGLAVVLIFLVLSAQFNSFRDPAVVLLGSVPLAMFGALIFTFLEFQGPPGMKYELTEGWTTTLNIYSQVGLVTLVGLVAKNGILIVEFANVAQRDGLSRMAAVREAAKVRLRPILMTTAATVAGHFPLTLVEGPGAAARNSIGLVLVGGMAIGSLFTLVVVPVVYTFIAKDRGGEREMPEPGEAEHPTAEG
ncbi:MAG: efflux RND transporter permease subunit [Nannocystaceae bacterium]|nr:efflux RND transporter permease subunit [bacterium]